MFSRETLNDKQQIACWSRPLILVLHRHQNELIMYNWVTYSVCHAIISRLYYLHLRRCQVCYMLENYVLYPHYCVIKDHLKANDVILCLFEIYYCCFVICYVRNWSNNKTHSFPIFSDIFEDWLFSKIDKKDFSRIFNPLAQHTHVYS